MKFMGMKHPALHRVWKQGSLERDKIRHHWVAADFDKNGNLIDRKITECDRKSRVRGYRIDKPELTNEPLFVRKWTIAVLFLLMGSRIGKIEAVR